MSPLSHFTRLAHFPCGSTWHDTDGGIYLNPIVLCFNDKECDKLLKTNLLPFYGKDKDLKDFLTAFKTVTFREDDELRTVLLNEQPKEMRLEHYDREGLLIRKVLIHGCKCIEMPDYEVEIQFDSWEDLYF